MLTDTTTKRNFNSIELNTKVNKIVNHQVTHYQLATYLHFKYL